MNQFFSIGFGIATLNNANKIIETYFPNPFRYEMDSIPADIKKLVDKFPAEETELNISHLNDVRNLLTDSTTLIPKGFAPIESPKKTIVLTILRENNAPSSVSGAYLKLHLLSHRLQRPHTVNLTGIFGILPNVAWTSHGPIDANEIDEERMKTLGSGDNLTVYSIDKFPRLLNYVRPSETRIADGARVRLGAYLGKGTTVMHEGFINFNAGTEGPNMVEGRISAGVFVGAGSDLGGGCSTMGTLSGGGNEVISVGKNCLLGANSGLGISLGDNCTIEAGLYITAGTKVILLDKDGKEFGKVKARELSGKDELLFRRNSINGCVECLMKKNNVILNDSLHSNN